MKIDINDPRITAFALGELADGDAIEITRAMRADPRIRDAVDQAREMAVFLQSTLGDEEVHMLTSEQRAAVRSVGNDTSITDIASAKIPFWKSPAAVGIGAAAAIAFGAFIVTQKGANTNQDNSGMAAWDWSKVEIQDLTKSAAVETLLEPAPLDGTEASATAVAAAMSEDTANFRKELKKRISDADVNTMPKLPELEEQSWEMVSRDEGVSLNVPLTSGAASWPIFEKYLGQMSSLPPKSAVRIEEMVNNFSYKIPSMLSGGGLVADIELCHTPWNPTTMLVAVHISYAAETSEQTQPQLVFGAKQIKRARLLGYSEVKDARPSAAARQISKTHGNYVLFEIEPSQEDISGGQSLVTLVLGKESSEQISLRVDQASSWLTASEDLRFASVVTATGMLISSHTSLGELDAERLVSMLDVIEKQQSSTTPHERKSALPLLKKAAQLLPASSGFNR